MKQLLIPISLLMLLAACKGKNDDNSGGDDGFATDTSSHAYVPVPGSETHSFNGFDTSFLVGAAGNVASRRQLLFMSIDSTYAAINHIETIKKEMNSQPVTHYSMQARNLRAKALNQLNILENALARQADAALLANLKQYTARLEAINKQTEENTEHLHEMSDKLVRVGMIMQNVTNVLTFCVSKGIIKPRTPVSSTAQDVKAAN